MKTKHSDEYYQRAALSFYEKKQAFHKHEAEFEQARSKFEEVMSERCSETKTKKHKFIVGENNEVTTVSVTRIEKATIKWATEKLEKRIPKNLLRKVVKKRYTIIDWVGMVDYLRSVGAQPTEFQKYIHVEKTVDEKALDQLGKLGELMPKDIAGCYQVESHKPYFTISVKKGNDDDDW